MKVRKEFVAGFRVSAAFVVIINLLPLAQIFNLTNANRSHGFPFIFAEIGEFGGPYQFDALAVAADAGLGLPLALLGGYLWFKASRPTAL